MVGDMKITVFTSSYNYSLYLRQAIRSVLTQTYKNFEYHLIDYGSTDNTLKIMSEYAGDSHVKIIQMGKQENKVFAMNKSIELATGDYWTWCPADDYLHPKHLERGIEYIKKNPGSVHYCDAFVVNDNGRQYSERKVKERTKAELKEEIWRKSVIGFSGIFIPMYIFREMKLLFPEDEFYSEDYRWMIEAVMNGVEFKRIPESLVYKRKHRNSCSNKRYGEIIRNINVIHEKLKKKYNVHA